MSVEWGDVASWLDALGSLLALGFAAAAVVVTRRTYRIESERDVVNADARAVQATFTRRAQAALVSAWWGSRDGRWGAFVRNASETPVYQVFLTIVSADDQSDGSKANYLVVPPGEAVFYPVDQPETSLPVAHRVKLSFTDAAGVRWLRNPYGRLTELQPTLCIKADPARAAVLGQFQDDFLATYGVTIDFQTTTPGYTGYTPRTLVTDLNDSSAIDALVCPHDWLGELVARKLIEPTVLSAAHREAFATWALSALTVDGSLFGLPTTTDTVALIRNTSLAPRPPATFDELIATGMALRDAGRVQEVCVVRIGDVGDPFHIWPLFSSAGGWLFGRNADGSWDPMTQGLAAPESIAAFERLRALGEAGTGMLRRSVDREEALELFVSGRSPYLLSASDALERIRETKTPIAVSAVPAFADGRPAETFTSVHGLVMARSGTNKIIAHDLFADYLTHEHVMSALSEGVGAPSALLDSHTKDLALQEFSRLCAAGTPMPTFPQMNLTWRILEEAEVDIIGGAPAEATAKLAATKLRALYSTEVADVQPLQDHTKRTGPDHSTPESLS